MFASIRKLTLSTKNLAATTLVAALLTVAVAAQAVTLTPAQKCARGKMNLAGALAVCFLKAEVKLVATGDAVLYETMTDKCETTFDTKWEKLENKTVAAGDTCPSVGDDLSTAIRASDFTSALAAATTGQRFVDNGDGTVTDLATGLMWEKKTTTPGSGVNYADPHDVDNFYTWSVDALPPYAGTGTVFTDFLAMLNGGGGPGTCFANHCDWRLPSSEELAGIRLAPYPCLTNPCIDPVFGPIGTVYYWTSSTDDVTPVGAGVVWFYNGEIRSRGKSQNWDVRAVRKQ